MFQLCISLHNMQLLLSKLMKKLSKIKAKEDFEIISLTDPENI